MKFHWESKSGPYKFKANINYVIYFKGCFAPPHVGHFNAICDIISKHPNVKVIINQIGSKKRHGVPHEINKKIWKMYIKYLLPKNRVAVHNYRKLGGYMNHPFMKGAHKLIFLRANENFNMHEIERTFIMMHRKMIHKFHNRGIKIEYYMQERNKDVISATKFVEQLIKYRDRGGDIEKVKMFLPKDLPPEICDKVIKMTLSCNLVV